jgi:hypothetical protein
MAAVRAVELSMPVPAVGPTKLDLVLATVSAVYESEQSLQAAFTKPELTSLVTSVVNATVLAFNLTGIFKKSH